MSDSGACELAVTSQIYTDLDKGLPEHLAAMLGTYVVISTPGLSTFPVVFPAVFLDDSVRDDILRTAFPETVPEHRKYAKNIKDALQLYAHRVAGRDIFLTNDRGLLKAQVALRSRHDIVVESLSDYLEYRAASTAELPN